MNTVKQKKRREIALERLNQTLKLGLRPARKLGNTPTSLTNQDKNRIQKEIDVLKSRI